MADEKHEELARRYLEVRTQTVALTTTLEAEDMVAQSMPDASPVKWHLAHTSWFFEEFVVAPHLAGYDRFHPRFGYLWNSYYNAVGDRHARPARGLLTRPTVAEVRRYRAHVDEQVQKVLRSEHAARAASLVDLGLHHEQQHQELILTDVKHLFAQNPLSPAFAPPASRGPESSPPGAPPESMRFLRFEEGVLPIGHDGKGFAFDNEQPRHKVFVGVFHLADRLVTNAEYCAFVDDGGYARPELWLDDGWATAQKERWRAPIYWRRVAEEKGVMAWREHTLAGERELVPELPVCHVSYYEADAFARWSNARLPTEAEWEIACAPLATGDGNFLESGRLHPRAAQSHGSIRQAFGDCWEWTSSAYAPYPGYAPPAGALGEYNGKFMINQMVLRGGSCATPRSHIRGTYRNFFHPDARWQFSGIRLAR